MFYWGVDKVYPQLGTHNVFLAGDYKASFDAIFNDNTPARRAEPLRPCPGARRSGGGARRSGYADGARAGGTS